MEDLILDEEFTASNNEKVRIYSIKAIRGFSVFFTTIFGGVLLMQNLLNIQKKKEAYTALFISIVITIVSIIILNQLPNVNSSFTFALNFAGSFILTELYQKKYFPDETQYEIKKIWKALAISILITIPFVAALVFETMAGR